MPAISVIIACYQPDDFSALERSIDANAQADAEWIVVDDGSGPEYEAVLSTLPERVRLVRLAENHRQAAARNAGLALASGAWIKFLDSDDELDEGHLSTLLTAAKQGRGIPFAPTRHIFSSGKTWVNDSWLDLGADPDTQLSRLLHQPFLHHCGALFPRALLQQLGGYDESLITDEDGDLLIRALMAGAYFTAEPQVNYLYIHHQGGRVSADVGNVKLAARLQVCDKVEAAFVERQLEMPDAIRCALALRLNKIAMAW